MLCGTRNRLVALVTVLTIGLTGCGNDDVSELDQAKARVATAEEDLAAAEAGLAEQSEAFCGASESYISALDRYGDLLTQTAVTVGDVNDAGDDLEQPRDEAMSEAEAVAKANEDVAAAQAELAVAEAELAAVKNPGSAAAEPPTETASPEPLVPVATLNRVEQAEKELQSVQGGIADETPLAQASQQFNAAVVALEMSWLRLFADAGCLTDEQQVGAEAAVRDYVTALQSSLADAGYYAGEVDGIYGPQTVEAVEALQQAHGLPTTGTVDKATADALEADLAALGGATAQETVASTAAVQQTLKLAGYWDGPVDGEWTDALTEALQELQTDLGVEPTGDVDAATVRALEKAIEEAQAEPTAGASESGEPPVPDSSEPPAPADSGSPSDG